MERICGIYKVTSPNNKSYIGQSVNIFSRLNSYKKLKCKKQIRLYRSLLKYGVASHRFEVIHVCDVSELDLLEKKYIDIFNSIEDGLNLRHGGHTGHTYSKESRQKMSDSHKGKKLSPAHIAKLKIINKGERNGFWGRHHTEETKRLLRDQRKGIKFDQSRKDAMKGKIISPDHRRKISEALKGRKTSPETRLKLSIANKGRVVSREAIEKARKSLIGRKQSPETLAKLSIIRKKMWQNPSFRKKMSLARIGKPCPWNTKEAILNRRKLKEIKSNHV